MRIRPARRKNFEKFARTSVQGIGGMRGAQKIFVRSNLLCLLCLKLCIALLQRTIANCQLLTTKHLVQKRGDWDDIIPVTPCHWDDIIPVDGGWLPHWDEALDESTGIIEAVYFAF